jgi:hypothetical protein
MPSPSPSKAASSQPTTTRTPSHLHRYAECHRGSTGALDQRVTVRSLRPVLTPPNMWPGACCLTCRAG